MPEIGTPVLMDKTHAVAHMPVIATLAQVVAMATRQKQADMPAPRVTRLDRRSFAVQVALSAVAVSMIVLSARQASPAMVIEMFQSNPKSP